MAAKITSDVVISEELDYKPMTFRSGSKKYTKIYQQTGGQTVSVGVTSSAESIFEIPIKAFNLSESFIQGLATPTAGGADVYNWSHVSHLATEVILYTRSGVELARIPNAVNYLAMVRGWNIKMSEFMDMDPLDRFYPSRAAGTTADIGGHHVAPVPAVAPYTEPKYFEVGVSNSATPLVQFNLRLGQFADTIFALKKSLMFGETILLRVVWGPAQRMFSTGSSATVVATATAVPAGPVTISNLALFLNIETDAAIVADLSNLVRTSGYSMPIPFVNCRKQYIAGGTTTLALTAKITPDMGYLCKRLIYAPFNATESTSVALDHDNREGAKIVSYTTQLDSDRLQEYMVDCKTMYDDWALHRDLMKGTPMQGRAIYQYNWVHCENFGARSVSTSESLPVSDDNLVSGIPISVGSGTERIWTISGTQADAAYNHYVFIVTYKTLVVGPGGISVINAPPRA